MISFEKVKKLTQSNKYYSLIESTIGVQEWDCYSFLGLDPLKRII